MPEEIRALSTGVTDLALKVAAAVRYGKDIDYGEERKCLLQSLNLLLASSGPLTLEEMGLAVEALAQARQEPRISSQWGANIAPYLFSAMGKL